MIVRSQKFSIIIAGLIGAQSLSALAQGDIQGAASKGTTGAAAPQAGASAAESARVSDEDDLDVDDRFSTEGFAGVYAAALQNSVPSLGITASIFLDDDFRTGIDLWSGRSKGLFSSFSTQGAGLWAAWEIKDRLWMKGGMSYSRLDRPTGQDPLAALIRAKDTSVKSPLRSDFLQADLSIGQLWSFQKFSLAVDYFGFSFPFMVLTGVRQSAFSVHALRADFLYDID